MDTHQWLIADSGLCDYSLNMAIDEALMENARDINAPVLRFYGWRQQAASFGYFQRISDIEAFTHLRPLVRRPTGGGLVPHDRDWTYSVAVPASHSWYDLRASESYERMHVWIRDAFALLGVATELAPCCRKELPGQCFAGYEQYDLLWLGRKIAGAAQRRAKSGLLIQGSIQPQPPPVTRGAWQDAMIAVLRSGPDLNSADWRIDSAVMARARVLEAEKYLQDSYNRKR